MDETSQFYKKVSENSPDPFDCPVDMIEELVKSTKERFQWAYHGQLAEWPLQTTLERVCLKAGIGLGKAAGIEREMIRHFQRLYRGNDQENVRNDTLYCMSLMQHHGAPTRLLDWTYSPLVAVYFALEYTLDNANIKDKGDKVKYPQCGVWRLNQNWCKKKVKDIVGEFLIHLRNEDMTRDDSTFLPLYMSDKPQRFVFLENPHSLHQRLHLQQGVFLCPGDVTKPFEENLIALGGPWIRENVTKFVCKNVEKSQLSDGLDTLSRMNINRETLFPGLDGFAKSMWYRQSLYRGLANARRGLD